jgi:hypothetical protein
MRAWRVTSGMQESRLQADVRQVALDLEPGPQVFVYLRQVGGVTDRVYFAVRLTAGIEFIFYVIALAIWIVGSNVVRARHRRRNGTSGWSDFIRPYQIVPVASVEWPQQVGTANDVGALRLVHNL